MTATTPTKTIMGGRRGGNILEFYTEEFKPHPSPIAHFRQHIIQWFFAAKHLRFFECSRLSNEPTEEDLASHRMICSALIAFGEFASVYARENEAHLDLSSLGIAVENIEAETRLLRDNFKMFHDSTMSEEEAESVLTAFNEA